MNEPPTLQEQIDAVQAQVDAIRDSCTDIRGEHDGSIPEPEIQREVDCLEAAVRNSASCVVCEKAKVGK